jgi:hypothetical protein
MHQSVIVQVDSEDDFDTLLGEIRIAPRGTAVQRPGWGWNSSPSRVRLFVVAGARFGNFRRSVEIL